MFGRTTNDIGRTLDAMIDEAKVVCRYDQAAIAKQVARYMGADRRFDSVTDKEKLARDAYDARVHGRTLDLTPRVVLDSNPQRTV
jgi:hypothetical protein